MVEVDRLMVEEFGILLIQMMENAGRNLADMARRMLGGEVRGKRVAVFCGLATQRRRWHGSSRHPQLGRSVLLKVVAHPGRIKGCPCPPTAHLTADGDFNNSVSS
jgi:NAD(P)H-hydrate epimerase